MANEVAAVRNPTQEHWVPCLNRTSNKLYLAIVDAIATDIQSGRLSTGDRLTPQRELAKRLGVNYATVSKAYNEAQRRGLIYSRVGQGSFVCKPRSIAARRYGTTARVDMTMNMPPTIEDVGLIAKLEEGFAQVARDLVDHLSYQEFGGSPVARAAGVRWLSRVALQADTERVLVCPGVQSGLVATLNSLVKPGDVALCEEITYPGLKAIAAQLGIRLIGLPQDDEGVQADAFHEACQKHHPKVFYCNPTLQNPTTLTVSAPRRLQLVRHARQHGLMILEDDPYGPLPSSVHAPFAALAPDITYYVTGLSKCVGAGLRVAYLLAPDGRRARQLSEILRATSVMASPITVALATRWIEDGSAEATLLAIRRESVARQEMVARTLNMQWLQTDPECFHSWLTLPPGLCRDDFTIRMRAKGMHVVPSDGFAVGRHVPEAVRLCLGGPNNRQQLQAALHAVRDALHEPSLSTTSTVSTGNT